MENGSKALLMAAEVLVGVLLLSLMSVLFYLFSNYQMQTQQNINNKEIYQFNAQFQAYENVTLNPQDVLTLYNLVKDYNEQFDGEEIVTIKGINKSNIKNDNEFLNSTRRYEIKSLNYNKEGKINQIVIGEKQN